MLVAFCTPYGGAASPAHFRAKAIVQNNCPGHKFLNAEVDLLIVSKARNQLVKAIPATVDVLWFVDSDVLLPPNAGELLDYLSTSPVVSGVYYGRRPPHLPQVYNRASPEDVAQAFLPVVTVPTTPFTADAVGAGCLVVKREIIGQIEEAHQKALEQARHVLETKKFPPDVRRLFTMAARLAPCFEFLEAIGEDFYFCAQLTHYLGIRPLVIPSVKCYHETLGAVGEEHYLANLRQGVQYSAQLAPEQGVLGRVG